MSRHASGFTLVELPAVSKRAFTLVELLVVVAIIVVLLALLVPGMERALYQAELTVCGTNQKMIASGAIGYTTNNQRAYPRGATRYWPYYFTHNAHGVDNLRDQIASYIPINKAMNCPLSKTMDFEKSTAPTTLVTYNLWFGWAFTGQRGMTRFGDRVAFRNPNTLADNSYSILVGDWDLYYTAGDSRGSHPDYGDRAVRINTYYQDAVPEGYLPTPDQAHTYSWWWGRVGNERGLIDMNFGYQDGSVLRYDRVEMKDHDDRMDRIAVPNDGSVFNTVNMPIPRGY